MNLPIHNNGSQLSKRDAALLAALAPAGIAGFRGILSDQLRGQMIHDAADLTPHLASVANAGIPIWAGGLYVDPRVIDILLTPTAIEEALGARVIGDFQTLRAEFPIAEVSGFVSAYGDYSDAGRANHNANWAYRDAARYQTVIEVGTDEVARYAKANIPAATLKDQAAAEVMNKAANLLFLRGASNLELRGMISDPSLSAALTPAAAWSAPTTTPESKVNDVVRLFTQLNVQIPGWVKTDSRLLLLMDPTTLSDFQTTNQFEFDSLRKLKATFKNLEIKEIPEYNTNSGRLVQLIVPELQGVKTAECLYTARMQNGPTIPDLSSYKRKVYAGCMGTLIARPAAIVQMLGM